MGKGRGRVENKDAQDHLFVSRKKCLFEPVNFVVEYVRPGPRAQKTPSRAEHIQLRNLFLCGPSSDQYILGWLETYAEMALNIPDAPDEVPADARGCYKYKTCELSPTRNDTRCNPGQNQGLDLEVNKERDRG